jgi:hypothetical protein
MEKRNIDIIRILKSKLSFKGNDETRQVKRIKEGENIWRVVYAD